MLNGGKMLITVVFAMMFANLKRFIYKIILYSVIVGIYDIPINIKNRICNYSNSLIESEKIRNRKYFNQ